MNRFFLTLFAISFSTLLGALFTSSSVSAVSPYDDLIVTTDTLILYNDNAPEDDINVTTNYMQYVEQFCPIYYTAWTDDVIKNWAVYQVNDNVGYSIVALQATSSEVTSTVWSESNVRVEPRDYGCRFYMDNQGQIQGDQSSHTSGRIAMTSTDVRLFISTYSPDYPEDYEGEEIPETYNPSEPDHPDGNGLVPQSSYTVTDLEIRIRDITDKALIDSFNISNCYFQLPNNSFGDNFTEYEYDCEEQPEVTHTFGDGYTGYNIIHRMYSEEDNLWYETTEVLDVDGSTFSGELGTLTVDGWMECMNSEFPFLHISACTKNLNVIGSLLSFNRFAFGSGWNFSNECRDLEVLDDWLNLSNNRVCPMIDMGIRNTITPFVTFAFGLMAITFISKKSGGGFD